MEIKDHVNLSCVSSCDSASTGGIFSIYYLYNYDAAAVIQQLVVTYSCHKGQWLPHTFANNPGNKQFKKAQNWYSQQVEGLKYQGQALQYSAIGSAIRNSLCTVLWLHAGHQIPHIQIISVTILAADFFSLTLWIFLSISKASMVNPLDYCD